MRSRISIRGRVRPSVRRSVRRSVGPYVPCYFWMWKVRVLGASCAVYPALFFSLLLALEICIWTMHLGADSFFVLLFPLFLLLFFFSFFLLALKICIWTVHLGADSFFLCLSLFFFCSFHSSESLFFFSSFLALKIYIWTIHLGANSFFFFFTIIFLFFFIGIDRWRGGVPAHVWQGLMPWRRSNEVSTRARKPLVNGEAKK